jgi:hypothetical protein
MEKTSIKHKPLSNDEQLHIINKEAPTNLPPETIASQLGISVTNTGHDTQCLKAQ